MTILTVNAGFHSLHLVAVGSDADDLRTSARLDRADRPSSTADAAAVREIIAPAGSGWIVVYTGVACAWSTVTISRLRIRAGET